jgi:hypothetical protein
MADDIATNRAAIGAAARAFRSQYDIASRGLAPGNARSMVQMSKKQMNDLMRNAMMHAAYRWRETFLPLRFTNYIQRAPFKYLGPQGHTKMLASLGVDSNGNPRPGVGGKGEITKITRAMFDREFFGWNPWSDQKIPAQLIAKFRAMHPGKYTWSITGAFGGMRADLRKWAKSRVKDMGRNLKADGVMKPLVLTGDSRAAAMTGQIVARVTASKVRAEITAPAGGPRGSSYWRMIKTIPHYENAFFAKEMRNYLTRTESLRALRPVSRPVASSGSPSRPPAATGRR